MTGEEAEKLKANLSEIKGKILQVKGALQNGEENDQKKVQEEKNTAKGKVDYLVFQQRNGRIPLRIWTLQPRKSMQ